MATCSQCGETLKDGAWTCGSCGAVAPSPSSDSDVPSSKYAKESADYDPQGYGDPDYAAPTLPPPPSAKVNEGLSFAMTIALWVAVLAVVGIVVIWFFFLR